MSIFPWNKTYAKPVQTQAPAEPNLPEGRFAYPKLYNGVLLNVLTPDSELLCQARLNSFSTQELELVRPAGVITLPVINPGSQLLIQGNAANNQNFTLKTSVKEATRLKIVVTDLELTATQEQRGTSRYIINNTAEVSDPTNTKAPSQDCTLIDISLTGARIRSDYVYILDQVIRLRVELYKNAGKVSMNAQIIRVKPLPDNRFEYGLLFEELPPAKRRYLAQDLQTIAERMR